jgi:hypothetical protein
LQETWNAFSASTQMIVFDDLQKFFHSDIVTANGQWLIRGPQRNDLSEDASRIGWCWCRQNTIA